MLVSSKKSINNNNKTIYFINIIASLSVFIELASMDKYTDLVSYTILFLIPLTLINYLYSQEYYRKTE